MHTVLRELRAAVAGYGGDRLLLGEVGVADPARWAAYYGRDDELMLPLNFGFWSQPFTAAGFRTAVDTTEGVLPPGAWPVYALGNHDLPRLASRYDDGRHGQARARLAAMLLLTLRGTPLLYYGDEIGMTDVSIPPESAVDPDGRDPARTPMQWDATNSAGFTTGRPWLPIPASARTVNVALERDEPGSLLNLYRDLIRLRRGHPALRGGDYQPLAPAQPALYAYLRRTGDQRILVTLNFGDQPRDLDHPQAGTGRILLSTHTNRNPPAATRSGSPPTRESSPTSHKAGRCRSSPRPTARRARGTARRPAWPRRPRTGSRSLDTAVLTIASRQAGRSATHRSGPVHQATLPRPPRTPRSGRIFPAVARVRSTAR